MLPLMLDAVKKGRLTIEHLVEKMYHNPKRIFSLPDQMDTYIEVDLEKQWTIPEAMSFTKSKWTPFAGRRVTGCLSKVVIRGEVAFLDGEVLVRPGFGRDLRQVTVPSLIVEKPLITNKRLRGISISDNPPQVITIAPDDQGQLSPRSSFLPLSPVDYTLKGKNIVNVGDFNRENLHCLFDLATSFRAAIVKGKVKVLNNLLKGKVLANVFYEPSTRTSCSFAAAMQRLGGSVIQVNDKYSSVLKGESLQDTVQVMAAYCDVLVIRHPTLNCVSSVAKVSRRPVINAGDGIGEHPTQALLDVFTIRYEIGTVNGLTITMVGDLKHGRTTHSLARLLTLYRVRLRYVSPSNLEMPEDVCNFVNSRGICQDRYNSIEDAIPDSDVLYMTRIQRERFVSEEEYDRVQYSYCITPHTMTKAKKNMILMHPLPRVDEISQEVDSDPRAAYFRQVECGMYVRMALLASLIGIQHNN